MGEVITLVRPNVETVNIQVIGTSPLICHRWSEEDKAQMLAKQTKKAGQPRKAKNPQKQYEASLYRAGDGYGFPSVAFKAAAVRAGTYSDMKMTFLRGAFHVTGELVRVAGEPEMREDMVRLPSRVADIRYRGQFRDWSATVPLRVNTSVLSLEQIANLFVVAGFAVGVGEWRPERNGQYGTFEVGQIEVMRRVE
jgi:hypothetical protein